MHGTLALVQKEEKGLVSDDRTTETPAILVAVQVILAEVVKVVVKRGRIPHGVAVRPKHRAAVFVGSRPGRHLNLPRAASELRICGRHDDADFIHKVRTDERLRKHTRVVPPLVDGNSVPRRHRKASRRSGNVGSNNPGHGVDQIGNIAAAQRKVA